MPQPEPVEIIVVDGRSTDATVALARQAGARVLVCPRRGRAAQLNFGAQHAAGGICYFLHADSLPPAGFLAAIGQAVAAGYGWGCFRLAFDMPHWFLRANAWFTRFDMAIARYGDQSLFVEKSLFKRIGGYREDFLLLEDLEITRRLQRHARLRVLPGPIVTSARKYRENGVYWLQGAFYLISLSYWLGVPQHGLARLYRALVRG